MSKEEKLPDGYLPEFALNAARKQRYEKRCSYLLRYVLCLIVVFAGLVILHQFIPLSTAVFGWMIVLFFLSLSIFTIANLRPPVCPRCGKRMRSKWLDTGFIQYRLYFICKKCKRYVETDIYMD